ncbi:MAG: sigma-70 family RNA polymerase sigma factor [Flavobacteriales bacterium]|nr:sigma-70 family RNA polymerase sigma factor [Flavobacteriales bacterium]
MLNRKIIAEIRKNQSEVLSEIYIEYREEFIHWVIKNYHCSIDDATDVYQNVILVFYENVLSRKVEEIRYDLKTYLFTIGKNKAMEMKRKSYRMVGKGDMGEYHEQEANNENAEKEDKIVEIEKSFKRLGIGCRKLLNLFYYQRKSIREITELLGYKNEATAKNQKYKCMQKLRELSFYSNYVKG